MNEVRNKKSKSNRNFSLIDKVVLFFNTISAILLIVSYFSSIANPRDFSILSILDFGYQVILPINILFIIYWLLRKKRYALISITALLSGITVFTSNYILSINNNLPVKNKNSGLVRVMAFNVREFYGIDTVNEQSILQPIAKLVDDVQPDVVTFEEYVTNTLKHDTVALQFGKILNTKNYYFKAYGSVPKGNENDSTGNAIFSKYPIINSGFISSSPILNIKAIFVDVRIRAQIVRIYCIHLAAVQIEEKEKKRYLSGSWSFLSSAFFIVSKLNSAFIIRSHQVEIIKKHMESCPYPIIVAGDFNDTPNSYAVNEIGDGLKNAFSEKGSGFGFTYYNKFPKLHIDYIFASPQFDVISYQEIDKKLSDHKPIVSDLKFLKSVFN